jgi:hypothetical protein
MSEEDKSFGIAHRMSENVRSLSSPCVFCRDAHELSHHKVTPAAGYWPQKRVLQ